MRWFLKRNILIIIAGFFFLFAGFGSIQRFLVAILKREQLEWVGNIVLFAIYGAFFVGSFFWFPMMRRLGLRSSLLVGAIPYVLFGFGAAFGGPIIIVLCAILIGLGAALLWNSSTEILRRSCDRKELGTANGAKHACLFTGVSLAVFAGGLVVEHTSRAELFVVYAGLTLLGFIILLWVKPEDTVELEEASSSDYAGSFKFWLVAPVMFVSPFAMVIANSSLALTVAENFGEAQVGTVSALLSAVSAIAVFSLGVLSDRIGGISVAAAVSIGMAVGVLAILSGGYGLLLASTVPIGIAYSGITPALIQTFRNRLDTMDNMRANAAIYVYGTLGSAIGYTATLIWSPATVMWIGFAVSFLAVPPLFLFVQRYPIREHADLT